MSEQENEARLEDIYRQVESYVRETLTSGEKEEPLPPIAGEIVVPGTEQSKLASLIGKKTHEVIERLNAPRRFHPFPDEPLPFEVVSESLYVRTATFASALADL